MDDNQTLNVSPEAEKSSEIQPANAQPEANLQPVLESQPLSAETLTDDESPTRGFSKKWLILGGVLLIFLAAAAFLGARLLKPASNQSIGGDKGPGLLMSSKGGASQKSIRINLKPAKELPQSKADTAGLFVRREDQSIFIGTGNVQMMVKKQAGSSNPADVSSKYDGPVVEVVVTHQTKIYQDITEMMPPDATNGQTAEIQQVVKPGSLDDLGQNMMVSVWGEKQGDRYIAKVISFR